MHIHLLHGLCTLKQGLFILLFSLSIAGAYPTPKSVRNALALQHHHPFPLQPRASPPETSHIPLPDLHDPYIPVVASEKFKKYSQWFKEQSKSLWGSEGRGREVDAAQLDYVSPYLTKFEDKEDRWWTWLDFRRSWGHFWVEVVPEWFRAPRPIPKEDVFLIRAMEQPSYMSLSELLAVEEEE